MTSNELKFSDMKDSLINTKNTLEKKMGNLKKITHTNYVCMCIVCEHIKVQKHKLENVEQKYSLGRKG